MKNNLDDECPICFEINGHNECILLDCCDKYIHKDCFESWLIYNNNSNCIYCTKNNKYINMFNNKNNIENQIVLDISNDNVLESNNLIIIRNRHIISCRFFIYNLICILFLGSCLFWIGIRFALN
jgi:hypothetical protein